MHVEAVFWGIGARYNAPEAVTSAFPTIWRGAPACLPQDVGAGPAPSSIRLSNGFGSCHHKSPNEKKEGGDTETHSGDTEFLCGRVRENPDDDKDGENWNQL